LGVSCGYIGKVGKDDLGHFYAADLQSVDINTLLFHSDSETGRAYTFITPDSERTFATYLGAAVELSDADIDVSFLKKYDLLHIEGYMVQNTNLVEKAVKAAKTHGLKVSLDLASFNVVESNRNFLSRMIPHYVDIVFANEEEAKAYTGKEPEEALGIIASQTGLAVVKVGSKGSFVQNGIEVTKIIIEPVKSVDTTGAGDQYAAGFLYGYTKQLSPEKCGKLGSLLAKTVVQHIGARIPKELWPQIRKYAAQIAAV
jgi:sugar/nucleoside kinase (ribokinase family)